MTKFHINKHGVPAPCRAKKGNCPLGGADGNENHFDTKEEAQMYIDVSNEDLYGILPSNNEAFIYEDEESNEIEGNSYEVNFSEKENLEREREHALNVIKEKYSNEVSKDTYEGRFDEPRVDENGEPKSLYVRRKSTTEAIPEEIAVHLTDEEVEELGYYRDWTRANEDGKKYALDKLQEKTLGRKIDTSNLNPREEVDLYIESAGGKFDDFGEIKGPARASVDELAPLINAYLNDNKVLGKNKDKVKGNMYDLGNLSQSLNEDEMSQLKSRLYDYDDVVIIEKRSDTLAGRIAQGNLFSRKRGVVIHKRYVEEAEPENTPKDQMKNKLFRRNHVYEVSFLNREGTKKRIESKPEYVASNREDTVFPAAFNYYEEN